MTDTPTPRDALLAYLLRLGDTSLVLGHRLSEWCGQAPELEEDIALVNVALDLVGLSRALLTYAGAVEGAGKDEDRLAYFRDDTEYRNLLLVEQPNGGFADTIARQFVYDVFAVALWSALAGSRDETLAGIAAKALKEARYHRRHSSEWVIRLGDGTDLSHRRMQDALAEIWPFTGEMFEMDATDETLTAAGIGVDLAALKPVWDAEIDRVLAEATLTRPTDGWMQTGGKRLGRHSEHLGHLLAEMQWLPRAMPDARW